MPRGSRGSSVNNDSPVRYAEPSISVITDGGRRSAVPSSTTHASKRGIDDRSMAEGLPHGELSACVQDGQARRRARAARRPVDLAVGEDRHVALLGRSRARSQKMTP